MKIALIEASHWHAPLYIEALAAAGEDVVGVSDGNPAVAARVGLRLRCPAYADYRVMVDEAKPDFVFAFGRHAEMPVSATDLIRAHVPFAMEKPMGRTASELEPLQLLAEENKTFVAVPFIFRCSDMQQVIGDLVGSDAFGELTNGYVRFIAGPPSRYLEADSAWLLEPTVSGGGCTINLGVHFLDLFLTLLRGKRIERVYAVPSHRKYGLAVEDFSTAMLSTADDVVCTIETGYAYPSDRAHPRHFLCCLTTTRGYLEIHEGECSWAGHDGVRFERRIVTDTDLFYPVFVTRTLSDCAAGRPPVASIGDMTGVMKLIDAVYKSGVTKQVVKP